MVCDLNLDSCRSLHIFTDFGKFRAGREILEETQPSPAAPFWLGWEMFWGGNHDLVRPKTKKAAADDSESDPEYGLD